MSDVPDISVVMSVYNGADHLAETLDSVLTQEDCDFEFIVVNDGSTDATKAILDNYAARDQRLRVIHQENTGLTKALIKGCSEARGDFIARQDAGDISLPGRLKLQHAFLLNYPDAVMCGCAVQFSGPMREPLYEVAMPMLLLDCGLRQTKINELKGPPHHGGTIFRRSSYILSGGYRATFSVAQDMDLWLRLSEIGSCLGMSDILYQARLEAGSISSRRRSEQFQLGSLALLSAQYRKNGDSDSQLLMHYVPSAAPKTSISNFERARFHYFIASCLRSSDRGAARYYYLKAIQENPLHIKALVRYFVG